ncbi:MAG: type I DNA topoisomerase [Stygiobacter sp.]|nr:MAG: DNA topoisomerase I [Stygiobacter sp. GWC2_38_9]OGV05987.1 MAG: DNA topoisomerase I [Stygiobacter sp. RIFOXYB2_FULL_37_11]OGV16950.1 MAG: DNA topoisomerase I [Stygiobacter sp. RIFOXYC2_FULL_38_25]OGV82700.1 MAG: DNA topoisomerase I [Stygiobacter sp. GWF2_38_21]RJQ60034.1 MAG: type I DNA topoisomerase [Stygiobacter sp.]
MAKAKDLILVESPSKAKTINKYVGKNYVVEATVGHIRNLPKTKLGIDVENGFTPTLLNIRGKGDVIKKIRSLAAKSDKIYVATDPDREGEAIAQDVVDILDVKQHEKIERVLFNEITKKAVNEALKNPIKIDDHLVISQRARRVMDRIIGYKVSPFLWRAVIDSSGSSLSAGRVQSVALRLICEREEEIEKFIATEYWSLVAIFKTDKGAELTAKLYEVNGKQIKLPPKPQMTEADWEEFFKTNFAISSGDVAQKILEILQAKNNYAISDISKKESRKNPYPPFITSSLQVESSRKLRMRPRRTMMLAQQLYEGIDLGAEGTTGLITYMRTDSTRLSAEIVDDARAFIAEKYGNQYLPEKPKSYEKQNKKNVQDAHEAVRPTSLKYTPEFVKEYLDEAQFKVYELIWKRFIACQMESARLETTSVSISADEYTFRSSGTTILFDGFQVLYEETTEETGEKGENGGGLIPAGLEVNQKMDLKELTPNQHFTKPPARFTESTLIKELENNGIGRPSTYAMIMGTIVDRGYVEQQDRKMIPTSLGKKVNGVLVKNFPDIINVNFTAQMEDELDLIANGETEYLRVLNDFYGPFIKDLQEVEANLEKIICEKCGGELDLKIGRFGKYFACNNYPECKNIKSLKEIAGGSNEPEYTGETCPKCESKTVYREGKFGKFIGCEKYPDCDFTKVITLGMKCPKCNEGEVITRRTKRGKIFYGCNKYPDCDYASWTMPKPKEEEQEEPIESSEEEY